jgi:hypothetical protein
MRPPPLARITVGVVVERCKAANPWDEFIWRPVSVLVGKPAAASWTQLDCKGDVVSFYVGATDIELYRTEAAHYRENLAAETPSLWVSLRPTYGDPPFELTNVTADPAEGESFTQAGEALVEAVPMPEPVFQLIAAFIAEHHAERVAFKRRRDRALPEMLERRAPIDKDRRQ